MLTEPNSPIRILECVWTPSAKGLKCIWVERTVSAAIASSMRDEKSGSNRKVA